MKKIKTILAGILALTTLGLAAACEGLQFVTPPMGGNTSVSSEEESSSKAKKRLTDKQWDEFVELMEKSTQEANYTVKTTVSLTADQYVEYLDGTVDEWYSEKSTVTQKYDGRLEEYVDTTKVKYDEDEAWETTANNRKTYYIYPDDSRRETESGTFISYRQDDDGDWRQGGGAWAGVTVGQEYSDFLVDELREAMEYDEETGVYSITDYEITILAESYIGMPIKDGKAVQKIHKCEWEVQDGYLVRAYNHYEIEIEGSIEMEGKEYEVDYYMSLDATGIFSNYGTTVIKLPSQIKAEVEALLEEDE